MTTQTELQAVLERLHKVERQCRRLKVAGILVLAFAGAGALLGAEAPKPKIVDAEKFVVRDSEGNRAELGVQEKRGVGLRVFDKDGELRVGLGVLADGTPGLALLGRDGKSRAALGVTPEGSPGLALADKDGRSRAALLVRPDGVTGLSLFDKDGKVIFKAPQ